MFCSPVLTVAIFVACVATTTLALPTKADLDSQTIVQVKTVDDISKLRKLPGVKLTPLNIARSTRGLISYTLGELGASDKLVSQASDSASWDSPQNVKLSLQYPAQGTGAIISFVQILVEQSSNEGQAYVVSGGLGERNIEIVVEAINTTYITFSSEIWGKQN